MTDGSRPAQARAPPEIIILSDSDSDDSDEVDRKELPPSQGGRIRAPGTEARRGHASKKSALGLKGSALLQPRSQKHAPRPVRRKLASPANSVGQESSVSEEGGLWLSGV
jgi:hypothetical protein